MKTYNLSAIFGAAALTIAAVSPAQAVPTWQYAFDLFNDGYGVNASNQVVFGASSAFEFYGMAVAEDENSIFLALNANLGINGHADADASGGVIDWGDIFLNFSGKDYDTAIADGDMFGIHFTGESDSGVSENGLYKVNTAANVAGTNVGFTTLGQHATYKNYNREGVGNVDHASYFNTSASLKNVILDGKKIGDIAFLNQTELATKGLNFLAQNAGSVGTQTFGFSFSKADLPGGLSGNMIATIFAECNNDGIGIVAKVNPSVPEPPVEDVPEPASVLGLITIASSAFGLRRRRA
jgi:hypothetical protein